ncbi:MAG: VWA domain-containing protein [bacterium]|nr:VWA domain-containing protein [bacterium]
MRLTIFCLLSSIFSASLLYSKDLPKVSQIRAENFVKEGFSLYTEGRYRDALICYKKALSLSPSLAVAWYWQGQTAFKYGLMESAFLSFKRYTELANHPSTLHKLRVYWKEPEKEPNFTKLLEIKGDTKDTGRFIAPAGIAIDRFDNLYIAGFGNDAIVKLSPFGRFIFNITHKELKAPFGIAIDKDGNIWVSSITQHKIFKFSSNGDFLLKFGKKGKDKSQFLGPKGIATDSSSNIYVVDSGNGRVQKFTKKGEFLLEIASIGRTEEKLFSPSHVVISDDDRVFVLDSGNKAIKCFDSSGNYLEKICLPEGEYQNFCLKDSSFYLFGKKIWIRSWESGGRSQESEEKAQRRAQRESGDKRQKTEDKKEADWKKIGECSLEPTAAFLNRYGLLYLTDQNSVISVFGSEDIKDRMDIQMIKLDLDHYPIVLCHLVFKCNGADVIGLSEKDFVVIEENRKIFPLGVSEVLRDRKGFSVSLVVDSSSNMLENEKVLKKGLFSLINSLEGGLQAGSLITFAGDDKTISKFTLNKTELRNGIEKIKFDGKANTKGLFQAIDKAISESLEVVAKKAIVVFTSINLEKEDRELERLINYAKNNDIPIFIADFRKKGENKILSKLAEKTNGEYFVVAKQKDFYNLHSLISEEVIGQNSYLLYYKSPSSDLLWDKEWVSLKIFGGPKGFSASSDFSYLIPEEGGAKSGLARKLLEAEINKAKQAESAEYLKKIEERRREIKEMLKKQEEEKKSKEEKKEKPKEEEEHKEEKHKEEEPKKGH